MKKPKQYERFDDSFYKLAGDITRTIERNKDGTTQQQQVETLLDVERKFKDQILLYRQSTEIYKKFLQKICLQNKNILSARPYFRESATTFSKKITPAIRDANIDALKTFDINYQLIKFAKHNWLGPFPVRAQKLFDRVHKARQVLIENNMPLAVNRARLFYRKTPRSHLSLLDLIGICGQGLAAGVDKWIGAYTPVFRSVCIGRMVGNMIDAYSETMLHFYPSDKRILYKANTIRGRQKIEDINELTRAVNKAFDDDAKADKGSPVKEVTPSELSSLMSAASTVSADSSTNEEGFGVYQYTMDMNQDIEKAAIEKEDRSAMYLAIVELPLLHRKVLRLKGIRP